MNTKNTQTKKKLVRKKAETRFVVRKPSTLKDYIRIYRIKNGVLKKAKQLEETLCASC